MAEQQETNLPMRKEIEAMTPQFKAALPPHIPVERFVRVVQTAINGDPDLLNADRRSLFEAATKAAQDGLLPDKREAAFVVFNTNIGTKQSPQWIKKVQYMPMVWGIVKKIRNSGELASITAHVVYENDEFSYQLGDDEQIYHKPILSRARGKMVAAYAIIKTKDAAIYREIMTREEIMAVREISKAKDSGPWSGPFESEMWRKSVIKRLSKRAPVSTDVEQLLERDDDLVDVDKLHAVNEQISAPQPLRRENENGDHDSRQHGTDRSDPSGKTDQGEVAASGTVVRDQDDARGERENPAPANGRSSEAGVQGATETKPPKESKKVKAKDEEKRNVESGSVDHAEEPERVAASRESAQTVGKAETQVEPETPEWINALKPDEQALLQECSEVERGIYHWIKTSPDAEFNQKINKFNQSFNLITEQSKQLAFLRAYMRRQQGKA